MRLSASRSGKSVKRFSTRAIPLVIRRSIHLLLDTNTKASRITASSRMRQESEPLPWKPTMSEPAAATSPALPSSMSHITTLRRIGCSTTDSDSRVVNPELVNAERAWKRAACSDMPVASRMAVATRTMIGPRARMTSSEPSATTVFAFPVRAGRTHEPLLGGPALREPAHPCRDFLGVGAGADRATHQVSGQGCRRSGHRMRDVTRRVEDDVAVQLAGQTELAAYRGDPALQCAHRLSTRVVVSGAGSR